MGILHGNKGGLAGKLEAQQRKLGLKEIGHV
jgi:hypothetical protein